MGEIVIEIGPVVKGSKETVVFILQELAKLGRLDCGPDDSGEGETICEYRDDRVITVIHFMGEQGVFEEILGYKVAELEKAHSLPINFQ